MAEPRATTARPAQAIRTRASRRPAAYPHDSRAGLHGAASGYLSSSGKSPQVADHCDAAAHLFPAWCDAERLCRPPWAPGRDGAIGPP